MRFVALCKIKTTRIFPAALCFFSFALAAAPAAGQPVALWDCWEHSFTASGTPGGEVRLQVELVSPRGRRVTADGFWDGGAVWRIRFMADEQGRWSYRTSSEPSVPGLDQQSGSWECRGRSRRTRFLQHGPLTVSADRRYLQHRDGTPFFWMADTAWNGALLSTAEDWRAYLRDRAAKHFSAIQFVATAPWRTAPTDAEGQTAFTGTDPVILQPRFFQRLDERIRDICEQGLLPVPVMLWAIRGEENPGASLSEPQALRVLQYLTARYGAYPLVWIPAGDATYTGPVAERWQRLGRALFGRGAHAPVVMHPGGMQWPWDAFRAESWVDLFGYQSGHGDDAKTLAWIHSGPAAAGWMEEPVRPILNLEPPYEGHLAYQSRKPHSDQSVRRAAYWSLLAAPPAGLTYGAHGIWSWQTAPGIPLKHAGTGEALPWSQAMQFPGSRQMQHLVDFFQSLHWWKLRPRPEILAEQPGRQDAAAFISAAESDTGEVQVFYLPRGGEVRLRAGEHFRGRKAAWFDPRTGQSRPAGSAKSIVYRAPDQQDWLLLRKR